MTTETKILIPSDEMITEYRGIDYGRGQSNVDAKTGIRYGVISTNSIHPEAFDSVWQASRDLSYEHAIDSAKTEIGDMRTTQELADWIDANLVSKAKPKLWAEAILLDYTTNDEIIVKMDAEVVAHIWSELEQDFNDAYSMNDCGEHDWFYDEDGYKLTGCLQNDVMILASKYFTYAQFCSPCVPGACNLDSPLITTALDALQLEKDQQGIPTNRCYCLGHDFFEDNKAPYLVYSVETGEIIQPG